jgi:hypothetical protein
MRAPTLRIGAVTFFRQPAMRSLQDQKLRIAPDLLKLEKSHSVRGTERERSTRTLRVGPPRCPESMLPSDRRARMVPKFSGAALSSRTREPGFYA